MLRKRVIPCLDVRGGRLVKGVNFESLRDCGDPVDAATRYAADGADEIVWLNIAAGEESWTALLRAHSASCVASAGTGRPMNGPWQSRSHRRTIPGRTQSMPM